MVRVSFAILVTFLSGCGPNLRDQASRTCGHKGSEEVIRIKPHHFIDIITAYSRGEKFEPHPYGHALHIVAERILANRDVVLIMELGADDICKPCKHNINGVCDDIIDTSYRPNAPPRKQEWNLLVDRRWCERLGIAQGDRLTARQFCEQLRDRAGDITDIYREIPAEMTGQRAEALREGLRRFLSGS